MDTYTRNYLRKRAHELKPVVMVGKGGVTPQVTEALDQALFSHELVKIRFVDFKAARKSLAAELAEQTDAEVITVIGNTAVLYRMQDDPSLRRYHAPKRR